MGKYTIQQHWPVDLKMAAGDVIRAKLERKWRRRAVLTSENTVTLKYCLDRYMEADTVVRRAKTCFDDLYHEYQLIGEV